MSTPDEFDVLLDSIDDIDISSLESEEETKDTNYYIPEDGIDPRLKLLSHSSRETLAKCPRKFQLYRLNSRAQEVNYDDIETSYSTLTLTFGTFIGEAVQRILIGDSLEDILFNTFLKWPVDIELRDHKRSKSLIDAVLAIETLNNLLNNGYLDEYELVYYEGKPAIELSFIIHLPDGFTYRGFIDVVLRHKATGAIVVLEDKTTYYKEVNNAQYKNSGQALGYSIFLDHIFPGLSSYSVLYLVYSTSRQEFLELPFEKSSKQKARWLTELIEDTKTIQMYESFSIYPMRGHVCYDFYKECQFLGLCTMDTGNLTKPITVRDYKKLKEEEEARYDFNIDFYDIVNTQLERNE